MGKKKKSRAHTRFFERFSTTITRATGRPAAFIMALLVIIAWAVTGPLFNFSDTWQLVINTSTTIITFLMVFLIQQTQNKDTLALQLKMDEMIAASGSSNRLIDIEDLTEEELENLKQLYADLSKKVKKDPDSHSYHSIDEALKKIELRKKKETGRKERKDQDTV